MWPKTILLVKKFNGIYQYVVTIEDGICLSPLKVWDNCVIILVVDRAQLPLIIWFNFLINNINSCYTSQI